MRLLTSEEKKSSYFSGAVDDINHRIPTGNISCKGISFWKIDSDHPKPDLAQFSAEGESFIVQYS